MDASELKVVLQSIGHNPSDEELFVLISQVLIPPASTLYKLYLYGIRFAKQMAFFRRWTKIAVARLSSLNS